MTDEILLGIRDGKYSLHDSLLDEFNINYLTQRIVMIVRLIAENKKAVRILFEGVDQLSGEIAIDAKNKEIILDFELGKPNQLKLYTTSDTSLQYTFRTIEVSWG